MQREHKGTPKSAMEPSTLPSVPQYPAAPVPPPAAAMHYGHCSGLELRQAVPPCTLCHRSAASLHHPGTRLLHKALARSSGPQVPHKSMVIPMVETATQHTTWGEIPVPPSAGISPHSPLCAPTGSTLTFSLTLAVLSPITRFCASRRDLRAAAVPRRNASPRCRSTRSAACCVACASATSPAVPLAAASASREPSTDARMLW